MVIEIRDLLLTLHWTMSRENVAVTDDDDRFFSDAVGLGCALEAFTESAEVAEWIGQLSDVAQDGYRLEAHRQNFVTVLDRYQEQPHLLDPHLPTLLRDLLVLICAAERNKDDAAADKTCHAAAAFAAHLIKVRKAKVVARHFPHEVVDVEPVLGLLERQDPRAVENWETRYVLLLWMSMLVLIPFDLARFDSGEKRKTVMERVMDVVKTYLAVPNKTQDAAAFLASKFLTRPEIVKLHLSDFLDWSMKKVVVDKSKSLADAQSEVVRTGALKALAAIHKQGKRDDLLPFSKNLLELIVKQDLKKHHNVVIRKLSLKVIQRIGLTFLKSKVASWRYQRGSRSLALNLLPSAETTYVMKNANVESKADDDEEYEIPEEIEEVIEELLGGLRDKETVIRWSAAKGIGRVTSRLPRELADDVVESLLQLFSLRETDSAWHGGCLATAELARRGLLLPQRLPEVVQAVLKALVYDEKKGSYSVGSHIRDAACYVCWAFARAYDPGVMKPYVKQVANALVTVAVFDREVNCRRAASAAFQENVGRQGVFPHGIDIVTKADYFAVGSRINAFLKLSAFVAGFDEYTNSLVDHLLAKKVGHWDVAVREITASALHNLALVAPDLLRSAILPQLLKSAEAPSTDLFLRHGSIMSSGFVMSALSTVAKEHDRPLEEYLGDEIVSAVGKIGVSLVQRLSLKMSGSDLLRQAISAHIEQCAKAGFPVHGSEIVDLWLAILDENLSSPDPLVQEKAVAAFPFFLSEYFREQESGKLLVDKRDSLVNAYLVDIDTSELHRRGISLALGELPRFALLGRERDILAKLMSSVEVTKDTEKWAEGRRDVIIAIKSVVKTVGVNSPDGNVDLAMVEEVLRCFFAAMDDYTLDRRGDIGAWVREAAMQGIADLLLTLVADGVDPSEHVVKEAMTRMAQQACEKIDRTRGLAAKLFVKLLLHNEPRIVPGIPDRDVILKRLPSPFNPSTFQWKVESETFPIFVSFLDLAAYRDRVILGLVVSVGGLTERLVKFSSSALFAQLRNAERSYLNNVCEGLLIVFKANEKQDRVTVPLMKSLDQLLTSGFLDPVVEDPSDEFCMDLLSQIKAEIARCGDPNKLMISCDVLCDLLAAGDDKCVKKALTQLAIFLCHKFPRMRRATAEKLFEALLTYSDRNLVSDDAIDEVNSLLGETKWGQLGVEELRLTRNRLCELMEVPVPTIVKKVVA